MKKFNKKLKLNKISVIYSTTFNKNRIKHQHKNVAQQREYGFYKTFAITKHDIVWLT